MKRSLLPQGGGDEEAAKRRAIEGLQDDPMMAAAWEQEKQDEELDDMGIPRGWRECPAMGRPIERFIPMKVPLGARFDAVIEEQHRFTVDNALEQALKLMEGMTWDVTVPPPPDAPLGPNGQPPPPRREKVPAVLGLVIDLTNSKRYYDPSLWVERGVRYIKIPCRGRGQAPEPEAVMALCWEMYNYLQSCPQGMALIHCTHGFNRTGYMVASYLARMLTMPLPKALARFAEKRPPGIYKHYYIRELFKYYHERLPSSYPFPAQPPWKEGDSPEQEGEEEDGGLDGEQELKHDDPLGEAVDVGELQFLQHTLMDSILGPDPERRRVWLPGAQPVSLDASNISLLRDRRYWVTWKADGTRYMLILLRWGTYLVDRKFAITRVQMRWPTPLRPGQAAKGPVGPMHHWTVLDGEMVVDEVLETGGQERRFLAYDMVMLNGQPLVHLPWMVRCKDADRWQMIQKYVMEPRKVERHKIVTGQWQYPYQYEKEPFRTRIKDFWPLHQAGKLIQKFIPELCHEADGLIFQGAQDCYEAGTCPELLKWKFAHMNSVDFRFRLHPQKGPQLELLETRREWAPELGPGHHRGYNVLEGAKVDFGDEDPQLYDLRIIECSYDPEAKVWRFMRERKDKDSANAWHVYESVSRSIEDNIQEEQLLQYVDEVVQLPLYSEDRGMQRQQAQQRQQPPAQQQERQQSQKEKRLPEQQQQQGTQLVEQQQQQQQEIPPG